MVDVTHALYDRATAALQAGNYDACGRLLADLKVALTEMTFLPSEGGMSDKEYVLARSVLELGAQWSIKHNEEVEEKMASFERYLAQLKAYYFDYRSSVPASPYMPQLMGAYLLCLLAQNRIAEFHTELESLDASELENVYIQHPVQLEQHLMEGAYNKLLLAKENVPADSYSFFMDVLVDTVRKEIADCCQASYTGMTLNEAKRIMFADDATFANLAEDRRWTVADGRVHFPTAEKSAIEIPADKLMERTLNYARELEKIV